MNQIEMQGKSVDALKAFNNAIVTSRLYPPDTPQVANAIERGYKGIKHFLHQYGALGFAFKDDAPSLAGHVLGDEVLSLFPNLVVYRQLRLLGFSNLLLIPEMDRFSFGQILSIFNVSPQKLEKEGGGVEYVTSLGLTGYFPETVDELSEKSSSTILQDVQHPVKLVKVRPETLDFLFGRKAEDTVRSQVEKQFSQRDLAIEILAATVGRILQKIKEKKTGEVSSVFPVMFGKAGEVIAEKDCEYIASGLGQLLADSLKASALYVFLRQEYPDGFGKSVFDAVVEFLSPERLSGIIVIFREQIARANLLEGKTSQQVQSIGNSLFRLMKTEKGKQFLGSEKARTMVHEGEKLRRKSRIEGGIKSLLQGNTDVFKSAEFVQYLPDIIERMLKGNNEENSVVLLKEMISVCLEGDVSLIQPLGKSIVLVADKLVVGEYWDQLDLIIDALIKIVRNTSDGDNNLEQALTVLQLIMQTSWQNDAWERGDTILNLFYQIRSGQIPKSSAIKVMTGKIQDKGLKRSSLPGLLDACLAEPNNRELSFRLILQGPIVARFLVEALINTAGSADRIKILDLLSYSGNFLPPVIIERLPAHMPWYGKRNLIKLLGETGNDEDAREVMVYLKHEDFRVQREAFLCIYKIGGKNRKNLLLLALEDSSELIKIQIIASLTNMCDPAVAESLGGLLENNMDFSEKNRTAIVLQLLETLGRCRCPEALKIVQAFLETRGQRAARKNSSEVWEAAEAAQDYLENDLLEVKKKHAQANQLRKNALKRAGKKNKISTRQQSIAGLSPEQIIRQLLIKGDTHAATGQLLELIEKVSRTRAFVHADKLRQWLVQIDPMAYRSIIRATEIIDREKAAAIDKSHLEIWSKLYDVLTTEEFSGIYYSLSHQRFTNEEVIVNQGTSQVCLYFINSGKVKLYFQGQGHEILAGTMSSGEIFGAMAFFEASTWTISVASVGTTEISVLQHDKLKDWVEEFPGLASKLNDFAGKFETIEEFIEESVSDRRKYDRYKISGRVPAMLIDTEGQKFGVSSNVELSDISEGGLSYLLRISNKENARLLLGRKVEIMLPVGLKFKEVRPVVGDILAVKCNYSAESDYSVHVRFDKPVDRELVLDIVHRER